MEIMAVNRFRPVSWSSGNGFVAVSRGAEKAEALQPSQAAGTF
jgi:hypothetical protein